MGTDSQTLVEYSIMGQEFSEPVVNNPNLGYVGVALRTPNKLRLIHAPPEVVAMTASVIKEINKASGGDSDDVSAKDKYGVPSYTLDEWCFTMGNGKTAATSGKMFTLSGYPWCCSGDPAIKSRQLISRISETMLAHGWALTQAIDISRSLDDKSVLLYTRAQNCTTKFACLALSDVHRLRFLDFYPSDTQELVTVVEREYLPG